jgi:hypothetical protein
MDEGCFSSYVVARNDSIGIGRLVGNLFFYPSNKALKACLSTATRQVIKGASFIKDQDKNLLA